MTALPARRRRKNLFMLAVNVVALTLVAVLLFVGVVAVRDYTAAKNVASVVPVQRLPTTPTAMFATVNIDDELTSVTMFVLAPGGQAGGSIVSVPVNADANSGLGTDRLSLRQAYASGGADQLVLSVESVLSLTIDFANVADPFTAGQILLPLGPLAVNLPRDVRHTVEGRGQLVFRKGDRKLSSPQAVEVLTGRDETETDLWRRPNIEAVWSGAATAIGSGLSGLAVSAAPASFDDVVAALFSGPVGARGLPTSAIGAELNPDNIDVELVDPIESILVFASIAPAAMSAPAPGLVFRIEAPPGYDDKVRKAIGLVLFFGGNVSSISLGAAATPQTLMYLYDDRVRVEADAFNTLFGTIEFPVPTSRVEGADLTLVLGLEYLQSPTDPVPPSTTTPDPTESTP